MTHAEQKHAARKGNKRRIPTFNSVEAAAEFWDTHSLADFEEEVTPVDDVRFIVTHGEPKKALTVRLPEASARALAEQAREQGIGTSALVRLWVLERLRRGPEPT